MTIAVAMIAVELHERSIWMETSSTATEMLLVAKRSDLDLMRKSMSLMIEERTQSRFRRTDVAELLRWLRDEGQLSKIPTWAETEAMEGYNESLRTGRD